MHSAKINAPSVVAPGCELDERVIRHGIRDRRGLGGRQKRVEAEAVSKVPCGLSEASAVGHVRSGERWPYVWLSGSCPSKGTCTSIKSAVMTVAKKHIANARWTILMVDITRILCSTRYAEGTLGNRLGRTRVHPATTWIDRPPTSA